MENTDFLRLFTYDAWANREALTSIRGAGEPERPTKLLAHIIAGNWLWLSRMRREKSPMDVWPELSLEQCAAEISKLEDEWQKFLRTTDLSARAATRTAKENNSAAVITTS